MSKEQLLNNTIEYSIEFAWQIGDNIKIPRAESRHQILNAVLKFIQENKTLPDNDIDEFILKYLGNKL
jgi:hypothetical protein